jgi:diguanylate cyclase (GGDEF)-like protein
MWRELQRIRGLGCLIFFSQFAAAAQQIEVFEDAQGTATIEQILANPAWFEKTDQVSPGFSDSTYWLRVKLSNESNQPREQVVQFHSHALSEVIAYRQLAGQLERFRSGTRVTLDQRPMPGTLLSFPFEMPANADHWIYFKVANEFEIALGHSILSPVQAIDKNTKFVWTNALIAGAILVLFIYNALIASATASRLYGAYSLFLLVCLVTFLVSSRLTEQWGWLIDRHSTGYTALAFFAFSFWFMDELFKDKLTRLSQLCSWLGILLLLGHPVLPAPQMIQIMAGVTVPIIFVLLGTKIGSAWRQGHRLAPYMALGWFLYIASNILTLLSAQGQLPPEFASGYAVGNLLEGLVFSAVLALRLRQQDRENQGLIHDLNKTLKHDKLTGLLNRTGIQDWLGQNAQQDMGLVLLDIDRFKSVNDTYSTQAGDLLLTQIALNLKNHVPTEGQIGRLGGDEFLIALPFVSEEQLIHESQQLVRTVRQSQIDYAGQSISRTASAGSIHLSAEHLFAQALTEADLALSNAKRSGGDKYTHFSSEFEEEMIQSGAYITDVQIETALRAQEFKYFVQPIYRANLNGTSVEGFEALIRWIKPSGELLLPGAFAKKFDAVFFKPEYRTTRQSMHQAVFDAVKPLGSVYISWNFSADQLGQADFVDDLIHEFNALETGSTQVVIELSEHKAESNFDSSKLIEQLERLRTEGFQVALDDFGVEHSNIDRLTNLPLDIVKLDRSLIEKHRDSTRTNFVIRSIVVLCRSLKLKIIAEGIETENDVRRLRACNVESQQGFWHARPMDPVDLSTVKGGSGPIRNLTLIQPN